MSYLPDPATLRAIAVRIGAEADAARARAAGLESEVSALLWRGRAAGVFDRLAGSLITALRTSAQDLDRAAGALRDHAAAVQTMFDDLHREGVDLVHSGHDIVGLLRDGADPTTLITRPGALLHDGTGLARDGYHLVRDNVVLSGDAFDAGVHGAADGLRSLGSLVGL